MRDAFGISTGLVLSGTIAAVTFAYVVRFLALSLGTVEAGLGKVTASMDQAARTLGQGPLGTLRRVHLPMIRASVLTAALLVFVDVMKELPMTLLLRPFNFHTLATRVYEYAADELLEEAALPAPGHRRRRHRPGGAVEPGDPPRPPRPRRRLTRAWKEQRRVEPADDKAGRLTY